jgi:hypothetical protein
MKKFWSPKTYWRMGYSNCIRCGKEVEVLTHPLPNEIEVGGSAVAENCPPPEKERNDHEYGKEM